jgi:ABC-type glutathione transport system ATPase component
MLSLDESGVERRHAFNPPGPAMTRPAAPATPQSVRGDARSPVLVEVARLSKRYGEVVALADLDLAIHPGEIYALLGPNGAGKTTTLGPLLGLLRPSGGLVRIQGIDMARHPDRSEATRRVPTGVEALAQPAPSAPGWRRATGDLG